jgi:hypothetical protein
MQRHSEKNSPEAIGGDIMLHQIHSWNKLTGLLLLPLLVALMLTSCGGNGKITQVQAPPKYGSVTPQVLAPHNTNVINANAGTGGTTSPSGTVVVPVHTDKTFTVSPGDGYKITDVKVDGKSVGAVKTYTFKDVYADHTISASFDKAVKVKYTIMAASGAGGSISPSGAIVVDEHTNQVFTITPNGGYKITDVKIDGTSAGAVGTYTFNDITANHSISAVFAAIAPITPAGPSSSYDGTYQGTLKYTYRIYHSVDSLGNPIWGQWITGTLNLSITLKTTEIDPDVVTAIVTQVSCSEAGFGAVGNGVVPLNVDDEQSSIAYLPTYPPIAKSDLSITITFPNGATINLWDVNANSDESVLYNNAPDTATGAWNAFNVPSGDFQYVDNPPAYAGSEFQFISWSLTRVTPPITIWGIEPVE